MTPLERAEKIFLPDILTKFMKEQIRVEIAAQIEEACAEAENKLKEHWFSVTETDWGKGIKEQGYKDGFSAAREKAKGIALIYGLQVICGHIDHDDCQKKSASLIAGRIDKMETDK